eukprot:3370543-Prymnesium_polylepis.1
MHERSVHSTQRKIEPTHNDTQERREGFRRRPTCRAPVQSSRRGRGARCGASAAAHRGIELRARPADMTSRLRSLVFRLARAHGGDIRTSVRSRALHVLGTVLVLPGSGGSFSCSACRCWAREASIVPLPSCQHNTADTTAHTLCVL